MANARNKGLIIQIDGGVKENNAALCRDAGVDWFVAGWSGVNSVECLHDRHLRFQAGHAVAGLAVYLGCYSGCADLVAP